jgi:hypothetical protein
MPPQQYTFSLHLSADQYLRYYQGSVGSIQVVSECGKRLRFPASRLRAFLTHDGISGRFVIRIDENQKFIEMRKIGQ